MKKAAAAAVQHHPAVVDQRHAPNDTSHHHHHHKSTRSKLPEFSEFVNEQYIDEQIFKHPFTCMMAGPSKSGKTSLLRQILEYQSIIFDEPPQRIIYCYSRWQPDIFNNLKQQHPDMLEFNQGLPDIDEINSDIRNLVILDDLMKECGKDQSIADIFTVDSHHKNISVFFLSQNLFANSKFSRTISLNCNYIIILNNPRDRAQIFYLARQMFPENPQFLLDCYRDAVEQKQYGYLLLDFTQTTPNEFRVSTNIIPSPDLPQRIIYQQK